MKWGAHRVERSKSAPPLDRGTTTQGTSSTDMAPWNWGVLLLVSAAGALRGCASTERGSRLAVRRSPRLPDRHPRHALNGLPAPPLGAATPMQKRGKKQDCCTRAATDGADRGRTGIRRAGDTRGDTEAQARLIRVWRRVGKRWRAGGEGHVWRGYRWRCRRRGRCRRRWWGGGAAGVGSVGGLVGA